MKDNKIWGGGGGGEKREIKGSGLVDHLAKVFIRINVLNRNLSVYV